MDAEAGSASPRCGVCGVSKAKVAVLISGRGSNMAALLYASRAADCPYTIVLVASNDLAAPGLALAAAEGIATFAHCHRGLARAAHDQIMTEAIRAHGADYVALAGYMRILGEDFVAAWQGRLLNIHPSLLPKYQGLHTHERALAAGDSHSGCSVHLVTAKLDDGPVLGQTAVAVLPGDTAETLAARVLIAEHQLYPATLANYVTRELQPEWILARVRELALAQPETHERASFGAPGWRVGTEKTGKYFAYFTRSHHGEAEIGLLVKCSGGDEQHMLIETEPERFYLPQFYGASGWIGIRLEPGAIDWDHISEWLARSWLAVAPKKLAQLQRIAAEF